jgi:hypothetical protein
MFIRYTSRSGKQVACRCWEWGFITLLQSTLTRARSSSEEKEPDDDEDE